jgi:hypothetical protein
MAIQTGQSELASAIYQTIIDKVEDGLERNTAFWNHLTTEGKMKASGLYVQFPIKLIANAASGFIPGTGAVVNVNPSTQLQYGVLNWKFYNYNVNFSLQEMNATKGKTEVVDYLEAKTKGGMDDANRELSLAMLQGDSSVTPLSFDSMLNVTAPSGTAYAGLLNTDYSANAYLPYIDTNTTVSYNTFNGMLNQLKARMQEGGYKPEGIMGLTNASVYSKLLNSIQNQQRFYEDNTVKTGFEGIKINGSEVFLDADVSGSQNGSTADNYLYLFPKKIMKLAYNYGLGNASPFDGAEKLPNQPIWSIQHYMTMNLVCTDRRLVAVNKTLVA